VTNAAYAQGLEVAWPSVGVAMSPDEVRTARLRLAQLLEMLFRNDVRACVEARFPELLATLDPGASPATVRNTIVWSDALPAEFFAYLCEVAPYHRNNWRWIRYRLVSSRRRTFVSYWRRDAALFVTPFRELLVARGFEHLFVDCFDIRGGDCFDEELAEALDDSCQLVWILGPTWTKRRGCKRPLHRGDWVRWELQMAWTKRKRILPLLVGDAPTPRASQLPREIRDITRLNATRVPVDRGLDAAIHAVMAIYSDTDLRPRSPAAASRSRAVREPSTAA